MSAFAHRLFAVILLLMTWAAPAVAGDCRPKVLDAWVRMPPGGVSTMPMMAGFARIENRCPTPATITSASSPSFGSVELHESRVVDGISRMRPVPELRLAPDGAAVLKPGGLHLMLMRPGAALKPGSKIVVEFKLADGGKLLGEFELRKPEI